jgi:CDP-diacylglycerol--glycerol-3-phosphate 3-phosphatidyltransferase
MFRHVPNALTGLRLLLAIVFFTMLSWYQFEGRGDRWLLNLAFIVYAVALFTDFLDGYLARLWKVEGAFGRVVDPFVDKFLVVGSFVFFAGKNFVIPGTVHDVTPHMVARPITGVVPAMVVIILARELLVTSLRGSSESGGQNFGAAFSGKLKMVVQSVTILVILVYVNYYDWLKSYPAAQYFRDFCIWLTVAVTVISGVLYVRRAVALYHGTTNDDATTKSPRSENESEPRRVTAASAAR